MMMQVLIKEWKKSQQGKNQLETDFENNFDDDDLDSGNNPEYID